MEPVTYSKEYRIHVYETDPDGKLNICSLFNYFQDIASDHAIRLGFGREDLMRDNHFWVLSRMYAEFFHWPEWGEKIEVRTWPNGTDKLFALRNFEATSDKGLKLCCATSSWLILDQSTRRIQRPESILSRFKRELNPGESPIRYASRLEPAGSEAKQSGKFRVSVSDLDVNFHTNNVKYIKWVIDTYEPGFVVNYKPFSAEINYLAESLFNEEVYVRSEEIDSGEKSLLHSIVRNDDNRELCHLKIDWKKFFENQSINAK